ncbi:MAG: excinuclease [Candidatus Accumulibacter sp.]|nr:excinuclease [Accumulibacter sp.]
MKKSLFALSASVALAIPVTGEARDTTHYLDFQSVLQAATADGQLDGTVKFYLKGQKVPGKVARTFEEAVSNRKTNAFGKTDEEACNWALRSVLIAFQENAKKNGANAVVDLVSYYRKKEYADPAKFECHAGTAVAGVAMKGRAAIVK